MSSRLFALYQRLALLVLPRLCGVITTSPLLREELLRCGCHPERVAVLTCCLSAEQEAAALALPDRSARPEQPLQLLFIGRLDSYKRLDWLLQALSTLSAPWRLVVVGDGPRRLVFESLSRALFADQADRLVQFLGRLDERDKLAQVAARCWCPRTAAMRPSGSCSEASGRYSGTGLSASPFRMGWVGQLPGLRWAQRPEALPRCRKTGGRSCAVQPPRPKGGSAIWRCLPAASGSDLSAWD